MSFNATSLRKGISLPCFRNAIQQNGHSSLIKSYMSARFESSHDLYRTDLRGHYGCVNAIEFSNLGGEFVVSGGDDRRVLLWNIDKTLYRKEKPVVMKGQHRSNIFCTVFDGDNRHLFSAGNDDQAMRHDISTQETLGFYFHDHPVYGLNVHPDQENVFLTACDNGKVLLWDARNTSEGASQCIAQYHRSIAFHAAVFNPVDPVLIATANSSKGVQLWDIRFPKSVLQEYSSSMPKVCAMGVKWNATGTLLSALRRRLPPVLYRIEQTSALVEFKHPGYNNICTMKSHCFAGDKDQYIISGSDDFNVYIWKVPTITSCEEKLITVDRAKLVLSGHRSIVNQVRFNPATHMIISAGVEKIVKVWSPWRLPGTKGEQVNESRRELYSHDDYVDLVLDSGQPLTHEYEGGTIDEDPRMLAFFDTLIQREQGGWNSDSDSNLSDDDFYSNFLVRHTETSDSDSDRLSSQRVRDMLAQETRDSDDSDETSQAVLRRMRRLRRAAFLRGLVRGSEHQDEEADEQHPADSHSVFIRHLTREIMREALESSSDSSDSEPTVTLALPEEFLESDSNENTVTERVEFHRSRSRQARQYRRRASGDESDPTAPEASGNDDCNSTVTRNTRRRQLPSSSSEEDSHEDECRINQLHVKRCKKRRTLDDSDNEQMNETTSHATIDGPSTSHFSEDILIQENSPSERCFSTYDDHLNDFQNHDASGLVQHEDLTECRTDARDNHCPTNTLNHNGHRLEAHSNYTPLKTHNMADENELSREHKT